MSTLSESIFLWKKFLINPVDRRIFRQTITEEALPESALLASAAEHLREPKIPNAFLLQRYRDALEETARRVLAGDAEAKKDFEARLKELVSGT